MGYTIVNKVTNDVFKYKLVTLVLGDSNLITARNEVAAGLCFYTCLSFCPQGGGVCHTQTSPSGQTPHGQTPPGQTPPCTVHAGIRSTSRRYASYWNAFLLFLQRHPLFNSISEAPLMALISRKS